MRQIARFFARHGGVGPSAFSIAIPMASKRASLRGGLSREMPTGRPVLARVRGNGQPRNARVAAWVGVADEQQERLQAAGVRALRDGHVGRGRTDERVDAMVLEGVSEVLSP
jgi:hypothetical protein